MTELRLNAYHIMWLFVFFDLPVTTKKEMKAASLFRKNLEKDGFSMMQFSVYIRHCASKESMDVHVKRVKALLPSLERLAYFVSPTSNLETFIISGVSQKA